MNVNASPETIAAVGEALKLASLLDDRVAQPDKARILAWAEKVDKHHFTRDDILDGVQLFYESPRERGMQVGDLIHHARIVKRERIEREDEAERRRREAEHDQKAEDEVRNVMAGAIMGRVKTTPRLRAAEDGLRSCEGKRQSMAAIREFFEAKAEAKKPVLGRGVAQETK